PSVDVQSVPRFTLLEHYGSQVYQKRKPSALAFMGSLCNATTPPLDGNQQACSTREKRVINL
ncbi:MAG: hypothetical protein KBF33_01290, partial [Comamonas sp.]|nr:hypothetical protein [Comamonas sp.]